MAAKRDATVKMSARGKKLVARLQAIDTSGDDLTPVFELHRQVLSESIDALLTGAITSREANIVNREAGRFLREVLARTKETNKAVRPV